MAKHKIVHDRDLNCAGNCVLHEMLRKGADLDLETYLDYCFLGDPPEGIEEDAEFMASVPDVILHGGRGGSRRVQ
jgi:hypothetical protein